MSSSPAVVGSLGTLGQECALHPLALLEACELLQLRRTVDTPTQTRFMTLMSSMAMGFMGILHGSARSLISGNAQYRCPFNLHLGGAMSLHLIGVAAALVTKLIRSTNMFVPLRIPGISLVQLVWVLGSPPLGCSPASCERSVSGPHIYPPSPGESSPAAS